MPFDPAFIVHSTTIGAVAHAERLVCEMEEAARLQGQAIDAARSAWAAHPGASAGTATAEADAWTAAQERGDLIAAALDAARSALSAVQAAT